MHVHMRACLCACMCACMHAHVHVRVCAHVCMHSTHAHVTLRMHRFHTDLHHIMDICKLCIHTVYCKNIQATRWRTVRTELEVNLGRGDLLYDGRDDLPRER